MGGFDFAERRVLVTGASHGIGFAVARAFADAGAELTILSSTADIREAGARIEADSGRPVQTNTRCPSLRAVRTACTWASGASPWSA